MDHLRAGNNGAILERSQVSQVLTRTTFASEFWRWAGPKVDNQPLDTVYKSGGLGPIGTTCFMLVSYHPRCPTDLCATPKTLVSQPSLWPRPSRTAAQFSRRLVCRHRLVRALTSSGVGPPTAWTTARDAIRYPAAIKRARTRQLGASGQRGGGAGWAPQRRTLRHSCSDRPWGS